MADKTQLTSVDDDPNDERTLDQKNDDAVLEEAKKRFKRWQDWESSFLSLYVVDVKFANGDADNGWQWPDDLRKDRDVNKRPTLTINKTAQHIALICNDGKQNKPAISIKPTGEESSFKSAQIYEGLIRHIEYTSKAQMIYDEAMESQVEGGIGYWRITTKWENEDSFDQVIMIEPVQSHTGVALDCDIKMKDGSDAEWGFIFEETPKDEFEDRNPDINISGETGLGETDTWIRSDYIREAEYYRIVKTPDELIFMKDEQGNAATFLKSDVPDKFKGKFEKEGEVVRKRKVTKKKLEWYKIAGDQIIDRRILKGSYIPIVRCVGIEKIINGMLERKGLTRALKDAQRMYNYNSSGQVEFGALATKTPWVGPKKAFEGNETAWNNANRSNAAYLTFNDWDPDRGDNGGQIAAPIRPEPPGTSPAFLTGMEIASKEMEMASGQYAPQKGEQSNERSGKAIAERQRQSDTANYHFLDHLSMAVRLTGVIIVDMAPYIYDTKRVIQIMGRDGVQTTVTVDPEQKQAYQETKKEQDEIDVLFNPKVGKYLIQADIGPAYSTQRQEAWNAFVQIVTGSPEMINDVGDLMFQSADFPLADKIAERLRRKIRQAQPWLFDENAETPAMQQLKQQLEQATQQVAELLEQLGDTKRKLASKDQRRDIEAFRAETTRVKDLANSVEDLMHQPEQAAQLMKAISQALRNMGVEDISNTVDAAQQERDGRAAQEQNESGAGDEAPPAEGAKKAPDGKFYLPDPARPGKWLRVTKNAA